MTKYTVAALQIGASKEGTPKTVEKILSYEQELIDKKVKLVVLPEATIGGYPKGSQFGTYLGYRLPEGRKEFVEYHKQSIEVPGPEISQLEGLSKRTGTMIVTGVIERGGSTLYCTMVYIDPDRGFVGKHRKLMPTATERLVWGQGDGSTLYVAESKELGGIGGGICWENYMPLYRAAYYAKGLNIYVAPTVDDREIWASLIKTIAVEGRQFAISAVPFLSWEEHTRDVPGYTREQPINGGSLIVDPYGEVLAGPFVGEEGLLTAEIDLDIILEARYDLDPTGHYTRPDVFKLTVDERPRGVVFDK
ncbi:putative nitrilase [Clavispora lusitaniae]|uniref:Hydrolase n=2 Tax=Clavispora lusitaniae TaxID=36911 RepID=A0AA91Q4M9_CLALS|nr:Nitrilase [Clavispora lusitaniae]OVF10618.1 putative hydrolase [Clavispora lusitaniae]QFZ27048.1 putative nitrilase [Clavispora lusitaniae]QFZ33643.1 putative nitrilase [Clavispora lusitaniae]QFZ39314.1 putative nitrilase [Clavispora lusitaniae]